MAFPIVAHHPETPTFELFRETNLPSVDNLDPLLTINGITVTPMLRYKGGDANAVNWPAWDYGSALALQAGTVPSYNQGSPLFRTNDDSVQFNAGGFYQADNNTFADITTEDIVIEIVLRWSDIASKAMLGKLRSSSPLGWQLYISASKLYLFFYDATGNTSVNNTTTLINNTWYHIIICVNRDEATTDSAKFYINGIVDGGGNIGHAGTLTVPMPFEIGTRGGLTSIVWAGQLAYAAIWKQTSWHQAGAAGPAEWAIVAAERFAKLTGIYPQIAKGTKLPTSYTRALDAYLDKYESDNRILYRVGSGWPRWCHRKDVNGVDFKGYLPEINIQNKLLQSENFITNWAPINSVEDGNNRIIDGDMEAVGTAAWPAAGSATVSKQGDPHGGAQCLRVLDTGASSNIYTTQTLTVGKRYRVTGWARTGGGATSPPQIYSGAFQWTGTVNTSWYSFDTTIVALTAQIRFYAGDGVLNSYAEFDDIVVHEYFPLDNFDNKLVDGNMETTGVAAWTAVLGATITKETGTPYGGSQVLRIAYGGTSNPIAQQSVLVVGNWYRVTGWARGDGSKNPYFDDTTTTPWQGTSSAVWQYFDVTFKAGSTNLRLRTAATAAGYSEWDDIQVSLLSVAPNKLITTMSLVADTTSTSHGVQQVTTLTAAVHIFSIFAKAGDKNWLYLSDDTVTNAYAYFNLSTAAVGTTGAAATGYAENWGNGWVRCCIVYTGTAAAHTHKIQTAEADGDITFAGDGTTINTYIWGAQVELGDYMDSYIPTTTALVTRPADVLYYKGDDGNLGGVGSNKTGTITSQVLLSAYNITPADKAIVELNDNGAATDRIVLYVQAATEGFVVVSRATGGNNGNTTGVTDISDNAIHTVKATWANNNLCSYVDGILQGSPDTLCDMPDDLDRIYPGSSPASGWFSGLMNNLKIYKIITTK